MKSLAVKQALDAIAQASSPVFIDVREPDEYASGHAAGAVNYPLSNFAATLDESPFGKDAELYVICQSGGRSSVACTMLDAQTYENVTNIDGGTQAWRQANLPME